MPEGGCVEDEPIEWVDGCKTKECPVMYYADLHTVIDAAHWVGEGFLPKEGGSQDQPVVLMQAIRLFRSRRTE